jgi:hypothetical protein
MVLGDLFIRDLSYVDMLFVVTLGWLLVQLWQRPVENLAYNTLGLNKDSTYHTFIVALVATAIFLVFVFNFDSILGNIVENDITGNNFVPPSPPPPPAVVTTLSINEFGEIVDDPPCQRVKIF